MSKKRLEKMYNIGWKDGFRAAAMQHGLEEFSPPPQQSEEEDVSTARSSNPAVDIHSSVSGGDASMGADVAPLPAEGRQTWNKQCPDYGPSPDHAPGEIDRRDPMSKPHPDDATPTLQAIGELVSQAKHMAHNLRINHHGLGMGVDVMIDRLADALERLIRERDGA